MPGRFDQTEPPRSRFDQRDRSRSPGPKSSTGRDRSPPRSTESPSVDDAKAKAAAAAALVNAQLNIRKGSAPQVPAVKTLNRSDTDKSGTGEIYTQDGDYIKDIEVNDLRNRYTLTKGATQKMIKEQTGADVTTRGEYYPDKSMATPAAPPLYLHITSQSKEGLEKAVAMIDDMMKQELPNLIDERRFRRRDPPPEVERDEFGRRKWPEHKIPIDMEPIPGFNLRAQVVGQGGAYVKHIQQTTNCRVQIKGRGSGFIENSTGQEMDEPMYLHLAAPQQEMIDQAKELCLSLLETVRESYNNFKERGPSRNFEDRGEGGGRGGYRDNRSGGYGDRRHGSNSYGGGGQGGYGGGGYGGNQYGGQQGGYGSPATPQQPGATDPAAAGQQQQMTAEQYAYYVQYYREHPDQDPYAQYGGFEYCMAAWMQQQYAGQQAGSPVAGQGQGQGYAAPPPPPPASGEDQGAPPPPPPPPPSDQAPPPPPPPSGGAGYHAVPPPPM